MSKQPLIYSFVAKGTVVLAEHTSFSGNFNTIAIQCLQKLTPNSNKYTYSCDGHMFNFLVDKGFVFLVVTDESIGRSVPFVFLERVKDDFMQRYGSDINDGGFHTLADDEDDDLLEDRFSVAYSLDREFGPRLKEHMQYCVNHPEEMAKLSKLKSQITEVKGIMMDNIEKVLDRERRLTFGGKTKVAIAFRDTAGNSDEDVAPESPIQADGSSLCILLVLVSVDMLITTLSLKLVFSSAIKLGFAAALTAINSASAVDYATISLFL
ncbi:vesicle-associated membrane protein 727 [Phoenix dactylifera]|uniref:Vesicle-associated membrane protein 727 n=1 Tax=Phoenix dactylifera TaxID=42345 RepID=A0A8B8ZLY7_PHODC|nr:vesicle-associated membrane protein 727 [Phoenix dactylifera]